MGVVGDRLTKVPNPSGSTDQVNPAVFAETPSGSNDRIQTTPQQPSLVSLPSLRVPPPVPTISAPLTSISPAYPSPTAMAHLQLTALAGGAADEMEEVALLGSYDEEAGVGPEAEGDRAEAGMRRVQVRVTGMTCSACTGAVEAALSARRGVRRAAVSLLQNRAHVVFDPALAKVRRLAP